jgi:WhiB family redox-sensing transcriptional regulator
LTKGSTNGQTNGQPTSQGTGSRNGQQDDLSLSQWQENSACRQADPEMFFPIGSTGSALDRIQIAKALCESCKVTETCLQYALETNQEAGVWGGYAEDERRRLRKRWLAERRKARVGAS